MPQRHLDRPRRVVDLHGDEREVEVARHALRFAELHRLRVGLERIVRSGHRDALLADHLDLLGPRIDERHVVAGAREECTDVASNGSGTDEQYLLGHTVLPVWFECPALSRVPRSEAMGKCLRSRSLIARILPTIPAIIVLKGGGHEPARTSVL